MENSNSTFREIIPGVMQGSVSVPPSKSVSHRLLIMAALSGQKYTIRNVLWSEDIQITFNALEKLGYKFGRTAESVVSKGKDELPLHPITIHFGNSGTSARLLTAVAAITPGTFILDGSPRMRERPMLPLVKALQQLGTKISHNRGYFPIQIEGKLPDGGEVRVEVTKSSQFLSALLLVAPLTAGGLRIVPDGVIASRSYVDLTLSLMKQADIEFTEENDSFFVPGGQNYRLQNLAVEGDYSSASYFAVGAAISGGLVQLKNLQKDSSQGDRVILDILAQAGARMQWTTDGPQISSAPLCGISADMQRCPDLVPSVAVLALFAKGSSRIKNISHLRFKESDRLQVLVENIQLLGGKAAIEDNDLVIDPRALHGALLPTHDDHRMAMSFALAGLRIPGVKIENPGCVKKSFPNFWEEFDRTVKTGQIAGTLKKSKNSV